MVLSADDRKRNFRIQLRMQIPDGYSEDALHKSLKKQSVSSFKYSRIWNANLDFGRQT